MDNLQFYPVDYEITKKMFEAIDLNLFNKKEINILDGSAGQGDLLIHLKKLFKNNKTFDDINFYAIEKDLTRYEMLQDKKITLLGKDFLDYENHENINLIVINPPFNNAMAHIKKGLELIRAGGQLVSLLNSETLKNPYNNERKEFLEILKKANAEVSYLGNIFSDVNVDVAMVSIKKDFINKYNYANDFDFKYDDKEKYYIKKSKDLTIMPKDDIDKIVFEYEYEFNTYKKGIIFFYENILGNNDFFELNVKVYHDDDIYFNLRNNENFFKVFEKVKNRIKTKYWEKVFLDKSFLSKLTRSEQSKMKDFIYYNKDLAFNKSNILEILKIIVNNSDNIIKDSVNNLFEKICFTYSCGSRFNNVKNIHLYNGWKTNNGVAVKNKFILPYMRVSNGFYISLDPMKDIRDIVLTFSYFSSTWHGKTDEIINDIMKKGNIELEKQKDIYVKWNESNAVEIITDFIDIKFYKKCTAHFKIKDDDAVRRFNIYYAVNNGLLFKDYGFKEYDDCNEEEKEIINSFENKNTYIKNINTPLIHSNQQDRKALTLF